VYNICIWLAMVGTRIRVAKFKGGELCDYVSGLCIAG